MKNKLVYYRVGSSLTGEPIYAIHEVPVNVPHYSGKKTSKLPFNNVVVLRHKRNKV